MERIRWTLAALAALLIAPLGAGNLDPPGAPAPSMATLAEIAAGQSEIAAVQGQVTVIDSLPFVIDTPGSYRVIQNLAGVVSEEGIFILTDDVTLDLGGFTLTGVPGALNGIVVSGEFGAHPLLRESITIRNGHLRGWGGAGINSLLSNGIVIRDVTASENLSFGIVGGVGAVIERCTATGNPIGIGTFHNAVITHCSAASNEFVGIAGSPGTQIISCVAFLNGVTGINTSEGGLVVDCTASNNGVSLIGGGVGIRANDGAIVRNCTASNNEDAGIEATGDSQIIGNTCTDNDLGSDGTGAGILVSGPRNRIEGNVCNGNVRGIDVDSFDNLVVRNRAAGNTGSGSPSANFDVVTGANQVGPIITTNGLIATTSPWANFER